MTRTIGALAVSCFLSGGCSLLLSHDARQCSRDSDCQALGFQSATCDLKALVCVTSVAGASHGGASSGSAGEPAVLGGAGSSGAGAAGAGNENGGATASGGDANHGGDAGNAGTASRGGSAGSSNAAGAPGSLGGASGGGGAAGNAGSAGAGPIVNPDWPELPPLASGTRIRVRSFCKQKLWVHAVSVQNGALTPDDSALATNAVLNLNAPPEWQGGQVFIFGTQARGVELHEVSASISGGATFFSLQYLQEFALPAEVMAVGGNCTAGKFTRSCLAHEGDVSGCPETFLMDGARCIAPPVYCAQNPTQPYCHALDTAISGCSGCPAGTTLEVYAGSGAYASEARLGAALNRGMTSNPDATSGALFYQQKPYNTYGKWMHSLCPNTVAFTHDDYGSSDALYPACNATELRITLCPAR